VTIRAARLPTLGPRCSGTGVSLDTTSDPVDASIEARIDALYVTHRLYLVRMAAMLVDDVASAEDVVQDAFYALYRRPGSLRDPEAALGYLRICVVNGCRSLLRRRRTARSHLPIADPEATDAADAAMLLSEEHRELLAAVRRLPRRQQEVLALRYWSDLSEAQISAALGISRGAVKSTASRAIERLSTLLGERT
jgi:RNA polymerase sigma-70 factor (sigma-E family)